MSLTTDLLKHIGDHADGIALADFLRQNPGVSRRSVQRAAAEMVARGRLRSLGAGPSRRYVLASEPAVSTPPQFDAFPDFIALSADSRDIIAYVERPLAQRQPVGYQPDFLESYLPNVTHYLSASTRRQLHAIGKTSAAAAPAGTYSRAILNRLLIDLSWASSHLEGNTYSRLDTRELIEHGTAAQGKAAIETQMILNHKTAIELLVENIGEVGFDRYTLMNLQSALSENLLPNPADEGRVRLHAVEIASSVYRPLSGAAQLDAAFDHTLGKLASIADPFEQSFATLVHLPYLQPFADMNKRSARLAANLPLFKANLCPLTFVGVPEAAYSRAMLGVYEMTRVELLRDLYVWAYERAVHEFEAIQQQLAEPDPLRLTWRDLIKQTIRQIVQEQDADPLELIRHAISQDVPPNNQPDVQALLLEELRRLHEGVLARYGLRPAEFLRWREGQDRRS
jgi:hypothetical protein